MFLVPAAGMTKKISAGMTKKISLRKAPNWWSVRFGHKNTRVKIKHAWDSSNLSMQCNCGVGRSIWLCNTSSIFSQPISLGIVLGKCGAVHGWWMIALLFPSRDPGTLEHFWFWDHIRDYLLVSIAWTRNAGTLWFWDHVRGFLLTSVAGTRGVRTLWFWDHIRGYLLVSIAGTRDAGTLWS